MPKCLCGTGDAAWAWMAKLLTPRRASRRAGEGRPQPRGRTARHVRAHIEPTCCIPNLTFKAARRPQRWGPCRSRSHMSRDMDASRRWHDGRNRNEPYFQPIRWTTMPRPTRHASGRAAPAAASPRRPSRSPRSATPSSRVRGRRYSSTYKTHGLLPGRRSRR